MQSKPKILVLKMRELIYTGIFLFLAIVLIVLLILMFRSEKTPEKQTPISTERYTAGVYSSPVTLGDTVVDVTVTVDPNRIKAISLNHLSETTSTMYPLIGPAVEELEAQILEKQISPGKPPENTRPLFFCMRLKKHWTGRRAACFPNESHRKKKKASRLSAKTLFSFSYSSSSLGFSR